MPLAPTPAPPLQPHPASPHSPPQQHAPAAAAAAAAAASCPVALSPPSESLSLIAAKLESLSLQSEVGAAPPQPHAAGRPSQLRPRPVRRGGGT